MQLEKEFTPAVTALSSTSEVGLSGVVNPTAVTVSGDNVYFDETDWAA